jgi:hypothetical protein
LQESSILAPLYDTWRHSFKRVTPFFLSKTTGWFMDEPQPKGSKWASIIFLIAEVIAVSLLLYCCTRVFP